MIYQKKCQKSHLKAGDFVFIQSGDNRGKIGKILSINRKKGKALINFQTISSTPIFIHLSNLALYDSLLLQSSRVGYKTQNDKKERYFKKIKTSPTIKA